MPVDLKKELKHLYTPSAREVVLVQVPKMNFLMVDGEGDPNTSQPFHDAIEALYGVSYTLKFMLKKENAGGHHVVMPLEGLWWTDDMGNFSITAKDLWKWTIMIMQPDFATEDWIQRAMEELARKKNPPALSKIRFESYDEGLSAQIMHLGPFSEEGPTVTRIHQFIQENGYTPAGKHHEIYLSDPRRVAPEKMRTVIRQPVARKS